MARNRERVQVGADNRPGLKKLGQLDVQARQRDARLDRKFQWKALNDEIEARQNTAVRAINGDSILFALMPPREQRRLAKQSLNNRAAA